MPSDGTEKMALWGLRVTGLPHGTHRPAAPYPPLVIVSLMQQARPVY